MELILSQDVKNLGKTGEVVKVKDGYARNFLLPQELAYIASPVNLKRIALKKKALDVKHAQEKQVAIDFAEKLNKLSCTVNVEVNDLDKLYGAVTDTEILASIKNEGYEIDKKDLILENPIDELGIFDVGIKLHPEVTAKIRLWVTKK